MRLRVPGTAQGLATGAPVTKHQPGTSPELTGLCPSQGSRATSGSEVNSTPRIPPPRRGPRRGRTSCPQHPLSRGLRVRGRPATPRPHPGPAPKMSEEDAEARGERPLSTKKSAYRHLPRAKARFLSSCSKRAAHHAPLSLGRLIIETTGFHCENIHVGGNTTEQRSLPKPPPSRLRCSEVQRGLHKGFTSEERKRGPRPLVIPRANVRPSP